MYPVLDALAGRLIVLPDAIPVMGASASPPCVSKYTVKLCASALFIRRLYQLSVSPSMLAEKYNKPLFLHERAAADDFIRRFKKHQDICQKSVVHCFTGDKKTLDKYLSMGFSIGVTGWICDDRRAKELREAVSIIPLDRILIETDAPYLVPRNVSGLGKVNVPQNIIYVARELAKYMKVPEDVLIENTKKNTERIFHISPV